MQTGWRLLTCRNPIARGAGRALASPGCPPAFHRSHAAVLLVALAALYSLPINFCLR